MTMDRFAGNRFVPQTEWPRHASRGGVRVRVRALHETAAVSKRRIKAIRHRILVDELTEVCQR
jgi:hypothetical protein